MPENAKKTPRKRQENAKKTPRKRQENAQLICTQKRYFNSSKK